MYRNRSRVGLCGLVIGCALINQSLAATPDEQYAVAADHYGRGRWELAAEEFRSFLAQHAEHPRTNAVRFFLGESLVQAGKLDDAQEQFRAFLAAAPEHRYARQAIFRLGEAAYLAHENDEAQRQLQKFADLHPGDPMNAYALAYLAEIAQLQGRTDAAHEMYQSALERFPNGPLVLDCRLGLARIAAQRGETGQARTIYESLAGQAEGRLASDAMLNLALLDRAASKHEEAIVRLERLDAQYPGSPLLVESKYWRAKSLREVGRIEESERVLRSLEPVDEQHRLAAAVRFELAQALRALGQPEESLSICNQIAERWPTSPWGDDARQVALELSFELEDFATVERLAEEFDEQHEGSSLSPHVRQMWGRALLKRGAYPEAIKVLKRLRDEIAETAEVNPLRGGRGTELERTSAYYLGLAYLGHERFAEADAALQTADPGENEPELRQGVLAARGSALLSLKRFPEAADTLRECLSQAPNNWDGRRQLMQALAESGDLAGAASELAILSEDTEQREQYWLAARYLAGLAIRENQSVLAEELLLELSSEDAPAAVRKDALTNLGKMQVESDQADRAADTLEALRSVAADDNEAATAALQHGRALHKLGRHAEAIEAYLAASEQSPTTEVGAEAMLAAAQAHSNLQQFEAAKTLLERILAEHVDFSKRDGVLYLLAWSWQDLGQPAQAGHIFRQLVEEHRNSSYRADALFRLAQAAHEQGRLSEATELVTTLLGIDSEAEIRSHALYLSGQLAVRENRWQDVQQPLDELLREFPESPLGLSALYWRAEASFQGEAWEDAKSQFESLRADPDVANFEWAAIIPLRIAQIHAQQKKWTEAFDVAKQIEDEFPDFEQQHEVDYLLGRVYAAQARFSVARQAYQRVIDSPAAGRSETAAKAQWMIGESYFHQKDFGNAIKAYHRVESLYEYPRWQAAALLQAAKCHEVQKNWAEASRLYAQLVEDYPESQFAREAADRMKTTWRPPVNEMRR